MILKSRTAAIIFNDHKEILMLIGKGHDELRTPGGKIEEGETQEQCLEREIKEETGLTLIEAKYITKFSGPSPYYTNTIVDNFVYICQIQGNIIIDNEIASYIRYDKESYKTKKYKHVPADIQVFDYLLSNNIR